MNLTRALAFLVASSCVVQTPPGTTPSPAGGAPASPGGGSTTVEPGYRGRLAAISTSAPTALDQLGELRLEIMAAYLQERAQVKTYSRAEMKRMAQSMPMEKFNEAIAPQQAFEARWAKDLGLLQDIKARRAEAWAAAGDPFATLVEYAWPRRFGSGEEVLPSCAPGDAGCSSVVGTVTQEFGPLPPVLTEHAASVITGVDSPVDRFALVDVQVRSVKQTGKGYVVSGLAYGPGEGRSCHGHYQTNEITNVTETTITIRQTDWCKKITRSPTNGVDLTYEVASPVPVPAKTWVRLIVDKRQVKCGQAKRVDRCVFKDTRVVAIDNGEQAFAGNQPLASAQMLQH